MTVPYQPSPGQLAFHRDRYVVRERALLCGTAAGKTVPGAFEVLDWSLRHPGSAWLIAEPDIPMLKKAMYPAFRTVLGRDLINHPLTRRFNQTDRHITLPNGSEWWFVGLDDPRKVEGIPEVDGVWLDEARVVRKFAGEDGAWDQLTRRLRGRTLKPRTAILTTHSPTKEIVDTFKAQTVETREADGASFEVGHCINPMRRFYSWNTLAAATWRTLAQRDADILASKYPEGSPARLRVLEGKYARPSGLVYDGFEPSRNVRLAPPPATADLVTYGLDLGWTHPAVLTVHYWQGESVHTVEEYVIERKGLDAIAGVITLAMAKHGHGVVHVGTDVRAPETVMELTNRGIPAKAYIGKVEDGILVLNSRLHATRWLIHPDCKTLIRQMDSYERDPVTGEPMKGDEDALDSARYGICGQGMMIRGGTW